MSTASFPPPAGETPADEEQTSQRPPTQTSIHIGKQARKASKQASKQPPTSYVYIPTTIQAIQTHLSSTTSNQPRSKERNPLSSPSVSALPLLNSHPSDAEPRKKPISGSGSFSRTHTVAPRLNHTLHPPCIQPAPEPGEVQAKLSRLSTADTPGERHG